MSEKASGLRQPSKIGRPCCTVPPKPAVPPSPSPRSSMSEYTAQLITCPSPSLLLFMFLLFYYYY